MSDKEKMCPCGGDTVYSETLTPNHCLNCWGKLKRESEEMEREARLDYEDGTY